MEKLFNPDINNGNEIFGLPYKAKDSLINIIPVVWDATTSYGKGTSKGPKAIFDASFQLDLFKEFFPNFWKAGISMLGQNEKLISLNNKLYKKIEKAVSLYNSEQTDNEVYKKLTTEINNVCEIMNEWVYNKSIKIIDNNKIPIVLGGDHSSPYGLIKALSQRHKNFGILQIDAHADLRKEYQGFKYSHASIIYNSLEFDNISRITQIGVRDYCLEEDLKIRSSQNRILSFTNRYIYNELFEGKSWQELSAEIIKSLPSKVYISFDIDGLDPKYCPNTGTPVPGGFSFEKISYLLELLAESGRTIIGCDLCEVCPDKNGSNEWDANVGARVLLELCMLAIYTNK